MKIRQAHLPTGWEVKKLSEVCERITDGTHQTPKYFDEGYIFLSSGNVTSGKINWNKVKYIDEAQHVEMQKRVSPRMNDILLAKNGTTGVAAMVDRDVTFDLYVSLALLRATEVLLPSYLLHYVNSPLAKNQFNKRLKGVGVPNLHLGEIQEVVISFPKSLSEQQRIVSLLDETFAAIEQAKANVERCMSLSKDLFQSELNSIFSRKGKGWEERQFKDVCVLQRGFDLPTHSRERGIFPLVSSNGITDRINLWKVKGPGVVTGRSGTIGNVHFVDEDFWPLNTSLYIKEFHGNYERCVYYFLKQFDLGKYSTGAGVPTLNRNNVHSIKVYFPISVNKQHQIVERLDALSAATKKLEAKYQAKLNSLEELKKSVLEKAFRGEI